MFAICRSLFTIPLGFSGRLFPVIVTLVGNILYDFCIVLAVNGAVSLNLLTVNAT